MAIKISTDLNNIPELAKNVAQNIKGGEIFALFGNLGAGKTTFVKAVAKELKIRKKITSPTFIIMNMFKGKVKNKTLIFFHLDLYRTKNFKEIQSLGIQDFWGKKNTVSFIEWADKIKKYLPKNTTIIKFKS